MTKFAVVLALFAMISVVWSQELSDTGLWTFPKVEATCWVSAMTACKIDLVLSLDGSQMAEKQYEEMSRPLKTPLEQQMMARVQHDIAAWWQSSPTHTKKGLLDTVAKSISVLPVTMKCRVKVMMLMIRPSPITSEDTTCQVQPKGCTVFILDVPQINSYRSFICVVSIRLPFMSYALKVA